MFHAVYFRFVDLVEAVPNDHSEGENHQSLQEQRGAKGVAFE
jgi:hypothetical protein